MTHPLTTKLRTALGAGDTASTEKVVKQIDRKLAKPELWGVTEVAQHLGIATYQNVYKRKDLPEPAIVRNRGSLWDADEIRAYAKARAAKARSRDFIGSKS